MCIIPDRQLRSVFLLPRALPSRSSRWVPLLLDHGKVSLRRQRARSTPGRRPLGLSYENKFNVSATRRLGSYGGARLVEWGLPSERHCCQMGCDVDQLSSVCTYEVRTAGGTWRIPWPSPRCRPPGPGCSSRIIPEESAFLLLPWLRPHGRLWAPGRGREGVGTSGPGRPRSVVAQWGNTQRAGGFNPKTACGSLVLPRRPDRARLRVCVSVRCRKTNGVRASCAA